MLSFKSTISAISADWKRYVNKHGRRSNIFIFLPTFFHNPGMCFSFVYRLVRYFWTHNLFLFRFIALICYPFYYFFTYFILDIYISPKVDISPGLYLHNRGIIIADGSVLGKNVTIVGPVTIASKFGHQEAPTIGEGVIISTGARVIGNVLVREKTLVGANAVVVKDTRPNSIVGGVPAKFIKNRDE